MHTILQDLRFAVRRLLRSPGFTAVAAYVPARLATKVDQMAARVSC